MVRAARITAENSLTWTRIARWSGFWTAGLLSRLVAWTEIALVLFAVGSYAYAVTDSVAGRVVDPQGASVAGAKVVLTNAGGVKIAETGSDAAGAFRFAGVESGVYRLSAEYDAFVRVEAGVALTPTQPEGL